MADVASDEQSENFSDMPSLLFGPAFTWNNSADDSDDSLPSVESQVSTDYNDVYGMVVAVDKLIEDDWQAESKPQIAITCEFRDIFLYDGFGEACALLPEDSEDMRTLIPTDATLELIIQLNNATVGHYYVEWDDYDGSSFICVTSQPDQNPVTISAFLKAALPDASPKILQILKCTCLCDDISITIAEFVGNLTKIKYNEQNQLRAILIAEI